MYMYVCIYARTYIHEHILAFGLLRIFAGEEKGAGRIKTLRTCGQPRDLGVCYVVIYDRHVIDIMTFVVLSARCASNVMLQCMHVICHIILRYMSHHLRCCTMYVCHMSNVMLCYNVCMSYVGIV